jgi:hypothetical protein
MSCVSSRYYFLISMRWNKKKCFSLQLHFFWRFIEPLKPNNQATFFLFPPPMRPLTHRKFHMRLALKTILRSKGIYIYVSHTFIFSTPTRYTIFTFPNIEQKKKIVKQKIIIKKKAQLKLPVLFKMCLSVFRKMIFVHLKTTKFSPWSTSLGL